MVVTSSYGWLIYSLFIILPLFLIFAMSWRWWREGHSRYDRFDHAGRGGDYDFNPGYIFPRGPHTGTGSKNYRRSDERIADEIQDRLMLHGMINATDIDVVSVDGVVTLSGSVDHRKAKRQVEEVADSVVGVIDVHNLLEVGSAKEKLPVFSPGLKHQHPENQHKIKPQIRKV